MGRLDINILQDGLGRQSASFDSFAGIFFELDSASFPANYTSEVLLARTQAEAEEFVQKLINDSTDDITDDGAVIVRSNTTEFFRLSPNGTLLLQAGVGTSAVPSYFFNKFRVFNNNVLLYGCVGTDTLTLTQANITAIHAALNTLFETYTHSSRCVFYAEDGTITASTPLVNSERVQVEGFGEDGIFEDGVLNNGVAGLTLGQLTNYPVHQKQSWRSHAVNGATEFVNTSWLDGETPEERTPTIIEGYDTAGIVIAGSQDRLAGTYFLNSRMAVDTSSDFAIMTHCRVIDKAISLVAAALTPQLDGPAYVATDTGQLSADTIGFFKTLAYDAINTNMVLGKSGNNVELSTDSTTGELPRDIITIDPEQNILSTENLIIGISLPPVGSTSRITLNIGLSNPALNN